MSPRIYFKSKSEDEPTPVNIRGSVDTLEYLNNAVTDAKETILELFSDSKSVRRIQKKLEGRVGTLVTQIDPDKHGVLNGNAKESIVYPCTPKNYTVYIGTLNKQS